MQIYRSTQVCYVVVIARAEGEGREGGGGSEGLGGRPARPKPRWKGASHDVSSHWHGRRRKEFLINSCVSCRYLRLLLSKYRWSSQIHCKGFKFARMSYTRYLSKVCKGETREVVTTTVRAVVLALYDTNIHILATYPTTEGSLSE